MIMLDDFIIRALLAAVGVALAAAPLGCFVVWRRMAYFSDATAHASILGVALSLMFSVSVTAMVLLLAVIMAVVVWALQGRGHGADTLLGVIAHSALAFGLVSTVFLPTVRLDLMAYLFGDVLAVSHAELAFVWGGVAILLLLIASRWSRLLTATLNADLASAAGIRPRQESLLLILALALLVAMAIKIVGVLLIAALVLIPAAAARPVARTPEAMAVIAAAIGVLAAVLGLYVAYNLDTPAGPSIVCVLAVCFALVMAVSGIRQQLLKRVSPDEAS